MILPNFPKTCMKFKEFGPRLGRGGHTSKFYYVDPPLSNTFMILCLFAFLQKQKKKDSCRRLLFLVVLHYFVSSMHS